MEILPPNFNTVEKRTYPWDEWLIVDNCPRILQRGEDYDETSQWMRKELITQAARRGLDINSKIGKGDRILFQTYYPAGEVPELPKMPDARVRYPWAEWFDGNEHELRKGTHFESTVATFKAHAYKQADKRHLKLRMEWPFADVVKLQAYKPEMPDA